MGIGNLDFNPFTADFLGYRHFKGFINLRLLEKIIPQGKVLRHAFLTSMLMIRTSFLV